MSLVVDIQKKLGDFNLCVNFEALPSQIFAILGQSGCGKSMTLKCIAGIETPDKGKIVLDGRTLFDSEKKINLKPQKRRIGYLFQNYALFPNMTVYQNIEFGIHSDKDTRAEIVLDLLEKFELMDQKEKMPFQLSGGQQQRVALARIFASQPQVIMLDEPLNALDSYLKWKTEEEIRSKLGSFEGNVLFVSHSRDEVYRLADTVAMMDSGTMHRPLKTKQIFSEPQTLSALHLTGCKNTSLATKVSENTILASDWNLAITVDRQVPDDIKYVGIRAHSIQLGLQDSGSNCYPCELDHIVEDIFEYIAAIKPTSGEAKKNDRLLYCAIRKKDGFSIDAQKRYYFSFDACDVIILRE